MKTIVAGNKADSAKCTTETAGEHAGGWNASWAGDSPEEAEAAVPKHIAASARGRNQGDNDINEKDVDADEVQKRRDFYNKFLEQALAKSSQEINLEAGRVTEESIAEHAQLAAWHKCVDLTHQVPNASARLFCFPWAGGNSLAFDAWPRRLPGIEVVPILLPGRLTRAGEDALTSISDIVTMSIDALRGLHLLAHEGIPFFVFGHELGALVAFELCRRLKAEFSISVLFVSGMSCPQMVHEREKSSSLCQITANGEILHAKNAEFEEAMVGRGQVPQEVIENKDLTGLFTPLWFHDLSAVDTYRYESGSVLLECPIYSFGGASAREQTGDGWGMESSSNRCTHVVYPGDDFFLLDPTNEHHEVDMTMNFLPDGSAQTKMLQFILDHCRQGEDDEALRTAKLEAAQADEGAAEQDRSSESSG